MYFWRSVLLPDRSFCRGRIWAWCGSTRCLALKGNPTTAGAWCAPTAPLRVLEVRFCGRMKEKKNSACVRVSHHFERWFPYMTAFVKPGYLPMLKQLFLSWLWGLHYTNRYMCVCKVAEGGYIRIKCDKQWFLHNSFTLQKHNNAFSLSKTCSSTFLLHKLMY